MTAVRKSTCEAALKGLVNALNKTPGSPYVEPYLTRRQAEALVALLNQRITKTP